MAKFQSINLLFGSIFIFSFLVASSKPSLLPLMDPFGILEHTPFGFENENRDSLPAARVDWKETPEGHVITMDVPGVNKEELKMEIDEERRIMKVMGERKREEKEAEKQGDHWHRTEISYGKFWRQFRLPGNVDLESVRAELQNGVLKVTFSKLSPDKIKGPRVVSILGGESPAAEVIKKSSGGGEKKEL